MAKIFVTRKLPFWAEVSGPLYDAGHEVTVADQNQPLERGKLLAAAAGGYDVIMSLLTDKIDAEFLAADVNKTIKLVANYAVGYDNIDVQACRDRSVWVTNTPSDMVNESVAEHAWALLMCLSRRIVEANDFMRNAAYRGWEPEIFIGEDMVGKTLGIVGMGRIGGMAARRAHGFGMKVIYYNRTRIDETKEKEYGVEYREQLNDLLKEADYISLHVPLTAETRHLINGKNLPLMKKTAILVNTARGPVVNEVEVAEALRAGMISAYGADVFETEPNPYAELLQMENVIMTPHIASATRSARIDMGNIAVRNIVEALSGKTPGNLVWK